MKLRMRVAIGKFGSWNFDAHNGRVGRGSLMRAMIGADWEGSSKEYSSSRS